MTTEPTAGELLDSARQYIGMTLEQLVECPHVDEHHVEQLAAKLAVSYLFPLVTVEDRSILENLWMASEQQDFYAVEKLTKTALTDNFAECLTMTQRAILERLSSSRSVG
jgi:hypothetical protein